jgi:hypothetical protein
VTNIGIEANYAAYARASSESNVFVNTAGEAMLGERVTVSSAQAGAARITNLGSEFVPNFGEEVLPNRTTISGVTKTEASLLSAGNSAEISLSSSLEATASVAKTNSSFLSEFGKVLGGRVSGGVITAGLGYLENAGKVDNTRLAVGAALDFAWGATNAYVSTAAGVAAGGLAIETGPGAIAVGVGTAAVVGGGLDYAYKNLIREPAINAVVDYGIPAYNKASTYVTQQYNQWSDSVNNWKWAWK